MKCIHHRSVYYFLHTVTIPFLIDICLILKAMPYMLLFGYSTDSGVLVARVEAESGLTGTGGLQEGLIVNGINNCRVWGVQSWTDCLLQLSETNYGYCIKNDDSMLMNSRPKERTQRVANKSVVATIAEVVDGEIRCCPANVSLSHLCFYHKRFLHRTTNGWKLTLQ